MAAAAKAPVVGSGEGTSLFLTTQSTAEISTETDQEPPVQQQRWRRTWAAVALLAAGSLVAVVTSRLPDKLGAAADPKSVVSAETVKCGPIWCDSTSTCCHETICEAQGVPCPPLPGSNGSEEAAASTTGADGDDTPDSHGARAFSPLTATLAVSLLALISRQSSLAA